MFNVASEPVNLANSSSESEKQSGSLEVDQVPVKFRNLSILLTIRLDSASIKSSSKQTAISSSIDDVLAELKSMSSSGLILNFSIS